MTLTYQDHFDQRGSSYDNAMQKFPLARRAEFLQVVEAAKLKPGMLAADVPAGGGYLKHFIPNGCFWIGHEPCASFTNHGVQTQHSIPLLPLPWANCSVDVAISLAGVHHISDKIPFFSELNRVVRPGGRLVVSDVATGSDVAQFLDGYVGANNSTGHKGVYLDERTQDELSQAGWIVQQAAVNDFHWTFTSRKKMASFCHALFDLRTSNEVDTELAIESKLGVDDLPDGLVGLRWQLLTLVASKS